MQAWKQRVVDSFDDASAVYEQKAQVQKRVASQLGDRIADLVDRHLTQHALEIGCGTGFLTRQMVNDFPQARWLITDASAQMLRHCQSNLNGTAARTEFQVLDGESVDLLDGQFDLVCSNLAFQWFSDLELALSRLMKQVRPGGWLIFTTMACDSFSQVASRFPELNLSDQFSRYSNRQTLQQFLDGQSGWCSQVTATPFMETHDSLEHFIGSLKAIGAGTSRRSRVINTSSLRTAITRSRRDGLPVHADYRILFAAAQNGPAE